VKVQRLSQKSIEFDVEHVDASIANAIRRVLIAEVFVLQPPIVH
jgi:DNA-directed RNA polymerase alpha subunit